MSHELTTRSNNFVEFAYLESDGKAWHNLGQAVPEGASIEEWTNAAGMEWRIKRSKVRYATSPGADFVEFPEQHVLFRSDTHAPLGIVSDGYKVVQPRDVLEFFRDMARARGIEITAAGTLFGGKRFWATAKLGEASPVSVRDHIGGYLLLSTSSDGSLATEARLTTIRTVCNNTLSMALKGSAAVRVTHRSVFNAGDVKAQMGLTEVAWQAFRQDMIRLAEKPVAVDRAEEFVANLLAASATQEAADKARESRGFSRILNLFNGEAMGSDLPGVRGTAYGLLNSVTQYVDHDIRARSADNRFASALWGSGEALKSRARDELLVLV